jgi:4-amino-4-deoxy-L-arabinose transferase-like glycosyltransferase
MMEIPLKCPRRLAIACVVLSVLVFLALSIGASLTKRPMNDEAYFANASLNLASKGEMGTTVLVSARMPLLRIKSHTYWVMPLYLLTEAGWYRLVGCNLLSTRLLSVLWGVAALLAWFVIVRKLTKQYAPAVLAVGLFAVDYIIVDVASLGRMDMMAAALGFCSLASYLLLREKALPWAILISQVLMASSGMTHPNAIIHLSGLVFLTLYLDRQKIRWRHLALAFLPYVVAGVGWGLYILQDPEAFRSQFIGNLQHNRLGFLHPVWSIRLEVSERYWKAFGLGPHSPGHSGPIYLKTVILCAYVLAIGSLLAFRSLRQQAVTRVLLWLVALYILVQTFFNQKETMYLINIIPVYDVILSFVVCELWTRRLVPRWLLAMGICMVCLIQVGSTAYRIRLNIYKNSYEPMITFLKQCSPPDTLVMGTAALGFDLGFEGHVLDDITLGQLSGKRADFVVMDEIWRDNLEGLRKNGPPGVYGTIVAKLGREYSLIYNRDAYMVYARNSGDLIGPECRHLTSGLAERK